MVKHGKSFMVAERAVNRGFVKNMVLAKENRVDGKIDDLQQQMADVLNETIRNGIASINTSLKASNASQLKYIDA